MILLDSSKDIITDEVRNDNQEKTDAFTSSSTIWTNSDVCKVYINGLYKQTIPRKTKNRY